MAIKTDRESSVNDNAPYKSTIYTITTFAVILKVSEWVSTV